MSKKSTALIGALTGVTKKWTKQRKREERERSALMNRRYAMTRYRHVSIKEAAWRTMESAFMKASGDGKLWANARQIMYAARPQIAQLADRDLGGKFDKYFTQTLLPDYIAERRPAWASKVVFDARGHFTEPHTNTEIGLGTLEVREYLARIRRHEVGDPTFDVCESHYPTAGPKNRYSGLFFLEKEGFDPLLKEVQLAERYDLAVMSTKGMSVTAARELAEELCATYNIPLLVLHDFDISGFTIFGTLRSSTRRFTYKRQIQVIDLGLRLDDIEGLERENDVYVSSPAKTTATLRRHGATEEEIDILVNGGQRVELNALASDELVALIERKLDESGITKVVPDHTTLADAFRRMHRQAVVQVKINQLVEELDEVEVEIPADLPDRVAVHLRENRAARWDEAVAEIVDEAIGDAATANDGGRP
jgi:hypothetical protein